MKKTCLHPREKLITNTWGKIECVECNEIWLPKYKIDLMKKEERERALIMIGKIDEIFRNFPVGGTTLMLGAGVAREMLNYKMSIGQQVWECEGCGAQYAEYINGCVYCWDDSLSIEENFKKFPMRSVKLKINSLTEKQNI